MPQHIHTQSAFLSHFIIKVVLKSPFASICHITYFHHLGLVHHRLSTSSFSPTPSIDTTTTSTPASSLSSLHANFQQSPFDTQDHDIHPLSSLASQVQLVLFHPAPRQLSSPYQVFDRLRMQFRVSRSI